LLSASSDRIIHTDFIGHLQQGKFLLTAAKSPYEGFSGHKGNMQTLNSEIPLETDEIMGLTSGKNSDKGCMQFPCAVCQPPAKICTPFPEWGNPRRC
jgi:hypothetical protein